MQITSPVAFRIDVRGVVQGVGFRPFVYRLAREHGLTGWVRNTSGCVEILVEGAKKDLEAFIVDLKKGPPMASIEGVIVEDATAQGFQQFEIEESRTDTGRYQLVSPDLATCKDCLDDITNPGNRRYRYPFTNCTNCGPRFTIIQDIPYDRPKTTMSRFRMCPECQAEYDNPLDRRFHAQPNACPVCGPRLTLTGTRGRPVPEGDAIQIAVGLLKQGKVLAVKGLGGFLLACDATNDSSVRLLRDRKKRPSKPFAVMMASLDEVRTHCLLSTDEEKLLVSPAAPIVLVAWKRGSTVSRDVAPNSRYLGVMLPYTPLHHLLLREAGIPLVMTSGNLSEEPIAKDNNEALSRLGEIADYLVLHDRDIHAKYDDSVYLVERGASRAVRRARGYAPYPLTLPFASRQVLACGAEEKNTFCLTRDRHAFISQHIGDLENEETLEHFMETVDLYKKLFRIEPEIVAYDMHPEYLSTKYAMDIKAGDTDGLLFVPVQHHHAHLAGCLVDNQFNGPAIGVIFDGTGYGTDGTIWGGEFLIGDTREFRRAGHLEYVPIPGGAAAIRKPYRMTLSYIYTLLGPGHDLDGIPFLKGVDPEEVAVIRRLLITGVNSPVTSSAGRLFDAVSAMLGIRRTIDYEAQAAIELEMAAAEDSVSGPYAPYPFVVEDGPARTVKLAGLIAAVLEEARSGVPVSTISARFHRTMAGIILETCRSISLDTGINSVALSGGVFQNRLLLHLTCNALEADGFAVLLHRLVPCNDGGISFGQAAIAARNAAGRSA